MASHEDGGDDDGAADDDDDNFGGDGGPRAHPKRQRRPNGAEDTGHHGNDVDDMDGFVERRIGKHGREEWVRQAHVEDDWTASRRPAVDLDGDWRKARKETRDKRAVETARNELSKKRRISHSDRQDTDRRTEKTKLDKNTSKEPK